MNPFRWLKHNFREVVVLLFAALVLINMPRIIRATFDPTAGELDGSVFQLAAWAGLLFLAGISLLWVGIATAFPTISRHLDAGQFKRDFSKLSERDRTLATLWTLTLLLAFLAVCILASHLTLPPTR